MAKNAPSRPKGTVLFCGAGLSVPIGYPVTNEIFSRIVSAINNNHLFGGYDTGHRERKCLKKLLYLLFPILERSRRLPDCLSICSVLSLIDHMASAKLIPIPKWQIKDLQELQSLLEQAIAWVIESRESSTRKADAFKLGLADYIDRQSKDRDFTFITTNYDIWLEERFFDRMRNSPSKVATQFDFGFAWRRDSNGELVTYNRPLPPSRRLGWYKLHGSFNWLRCDLCGQIYINTSESIVEYSLLVKKSFDTVCHCGRFPLQPMLVSPSFVRDVRDSNLLEIWRHSLEALRIANEWIFVGYSFPEEDYMIRAMLLRAYNGWERSGRQKRPKVRIISRPPPTESSDAEIANREFNNMRARVLAVLPGTKFERIGAEGLVLSKE